MPEIRETHVVWLEKDSFRVEIPRPAAAHVWTEYNHTPPETLLQRIAPANVLIVNKCRIGPAELDTCPHLEMIAITATGTDNVDLNACEARGITVKNVVNYGAHAVAEHVMASLLTLTRHIREWSDLAHDGSWSESRFFCLHTHAMRSLSSQTLGILGSGAIGQQLALFAQAFGMSVIRLERQGARQVRPGYVPFEQGLKTVDALSLHCPLNPETRGLINRKTLALMKPDAIVLNTARGGLIVFEDLLEALEAGRLGGAAIDVLDVEPPPKHHTMVRASHPRLLLTPHVAWATVEAQTTLAGRVKQNIDAFLSARPK
ncbi:MAG: D-2-hydroxyacid dehydrogenase [Burkholderiales bacterium]|jgi:glycerate dehydrogenase|nr:D-2-hydroxyacid dehydrogenase [Burkholderiales bacterium]